jgi:predicted RecB family nuclease
MSNVHIGEKNDNYSKDDIVATNQIIDALTTCKEMLHPQKEGEISSVRTQMASCVLCTKSNMCL